MTTQSEITVHPVARFAFMIMPNGLALTIGYVDGNTRPKDQEELNKATRALTVGLDATQATELARELLRAADMLKSRVGHGN